MGNEDEKGRYGFSLQFKAMDALSFKGVPGQNGCPKNLIDQLHFHVECEKAVSRAIFELVDEHEYEDGELDQARGLTGDPRRDRRREREVAWKQMDWPARERFMLEQLGEDRLTVAEVWKRLHEDADLGLSEASIRSLLVRMVDGGELDRTPELFRGRTRWRYSRRTELSGPIKALNDALGDDS